MADRSGVAAILLAAGQSRRMGAANKLLMDIDGEPMVRRAARTLLASRAREIVVVLGHQAADVTVALSGLALRLIDNPAHAEGQMTSVRRGLDALPDRYAGILVGLADQPALTPADIDFLIDAFEGGDGQRIAVPVSDGRRGNPIVLSAENRAVMDGNEINFGCRNLIARNPELVHSVPVTNDRYFKDIDTPDDYAAIAGNAANL